MRRWHFLLLAVLLTLSGCGKTGLPEESTPAVTETAEVTETAVSSHCELYLPGYTADQIRVYFEEVVLNMEYTDGTGDATVVQKWLEPIRYEVYGTPTEEDLRVLEDVFARLNEISGFPGIRPAEYPGQENMSIHFLEADAFRENFSYVIRGEEADGAAQFWYYTDTNELYAARIGYRTDLEQSVRSSVLVEEIINTLGISDTVLRPDSVVYQYSNENMALSDVDLVILKLLYNPAVQCGMDAEACGAVIRECYY